MKKLPQLTDHSGYTIAQQERESIRSAMDTLKAEADAKAHQAADLKKRIVTIEDLDEVEELEKQAARVAKRAELMQPSLDRAMQAEEFKRGEAAKVIIAAAEAERELIMIEAFAAIDTLVGSGSL